jgi:CspA family cold shock protein
MERRIGKVKWFSAQKGYGFIEQVDGEDIFIHFSTIKMDGYRKLQEGQQVKYTLIKGERGLQAEDVVPLPAASQSA